MKRTLGLKLVGFHSGENLVVLASPWQINASVLASSLWSSSYKQMQGDNSWVHQRETRQGLVANFWSSSLSSQD